MSSIFDIEKKITPEWLKENGWFKTPSMTVDRNPWWSKTFDGLRPNGGTLDIRFSYNDETQEVIYMLGFPYQTMHTEDVTDIELFIKIQLKNFKPIQTLYGTRYLQKQ